MSRSPHSAPAAGRPYHLSVFSSLSRRGLVALVLCTTCGFLFSIASSLFLWQKNRAIAEHRFLVLGERLAELLRRRVQSYEYGLFGARGALTAAERTDRQTFRRYHQTRELAREFPGSFGYGFIRYVPRDQEAAFLSQVRSEQAPDFQIHDLQPHDGPHFVIQYIEPEAPNREAVGLDIGTEPRRRDAALQAAHSGRPTISAPIRLVQSHVPVAGFLYFLPMYRPGLPTETPEQRQAALLGWAYTPLQIDRILSGIGEVADNQLDFALFDGDQAEPQALIYASSAYESEASWRRRHTDPLSYQLSMEAGGRRWLMRIEALPSFRANLRLTPAALILLAGFLVTVLMAVALGAVLGTGRRAQALAEQMTATLKEQEQRLNLAVQSAGLALWQWDQGALRLSGTGPLERALGYLPGELPEDLAAWRARVHPEDLSRVRNLFLEQLAGRRVQIQTELRLRGKSGEERWFLVTGAVVEGGGDGAAARLVGTLLDVTDRTLHAQRLAEAKEAAEAASRAKSEFLANVSHELRTPLNAVLGFTALLLDGKLGGKLDAAPEQHVRAIRAAGEALLGQVDALLDLARLDAGTLPLQRRPVALRGLLAGALDRVRAPAAVRGLPLRCTVDPACPERIVTDPDRLQQALVQLLQNAVKFTPHGEVSVRAAVIPGTSAETDAAPRLGIEVEDTGIGIAAEALPRLFQPFSQADGSTTRRYGGTGLGLALVRRLIEAMDGQVGVTSAPGRGSRFFIELPLVAAPAAPVDPAAVEKIAAAEPAVNERTGAPVRVLVAEDNPANQTVAALMLTKLGCRVDVAANGREALEAASAQLYDLIFMDCQMPEVDGYEATERIRRLPGRHGQVPIVALTANTFASDRERCSAVGMNDFVGKPVSVPMLVQVLKRWLPQSPVPPREATAALPESDVQGLEAALAEQRALLGPEVIRELIRLFCVEAEQRPRELREALARGDRDALRTTAQRLRGSALQLGALRTAGLCAQLEELARSGGEDGARAGDNAGQLGAALDRLADSLARCSAYLRERA
ncbi:MAG: CHASE domain-containing protein [Polyangia bacterium]